MRWVWKPYRLPWLRLGAALLVTAPAVGAVSAAATGGVLPDGTLAMLRNLAGMTRHRPAVRGRAGRPVRVDGPDGLPASHRERAGRGLDHAVDLARPANRTASAGRSARPPCSPPGSWP